MRAQTLTARDWIDVGESSQSERDLRVTALFDQHYGPLRDLASVILGDRYLAEEIVMEALVKTFTGWGRIRDVDRADVYLRRAVINLCRSKIRRKGIEGRVNSIAHRREERKAPDWDPEIHETARGVWEAVKDLPVRQRACIVLFYMEDLPEGQIGEILDCSVGTVRSQLSRARDKLRKSLGAER